MKLLVNLSRWLFGLSKRLYRRLTTGGCSVCGTKKPKRISNESGMLHYWVAYTLTCSGTIWINRKEYDPDYLLNEYEVFCAQCYKARGGQHQTYTELIDQYVDESDK